MAEPTDLEAALERLARLAGSVESEPDPAFRERAVELLESVDDVHRRLVWALGERVWTEQPELFERLLADPVAGVLFEMYGLVTPARAAEERAEAQPAVVVGVADLEASIPAPRRWESAGAPGELAEGALAGRDLEGTRVLLLRTGGVVRAYRDACPPTPMPLSAGALRDGALLCPWHDCRFDARTGARLDREGPSLEPVPVAERDGEIRVSVPLRSRSAA